MALSSIFRRSKVAQEIPRGSSIPLEEGRVLYFAYTSDSMLPLTLTGCPFSALKAISLPKCVMYISPLVSMPENTRTT